MPRKKGSSFVKYTRVGGGVRVPRKISQKIIVFRGTRSQRIATRPRSKPLGGEGRPAGAGGGKGRRCQPGKGEKGEIRNPAKGRRSFRENRRKRGQWSSRGPESLSSGEGRFRRKRGGEIPSRREKKIFLGASRQWGKGAEA